MLCGPPRRRRRRVAAGVGRDGPVGARPRSGDLAGILFDASMCRTMADREPWSPSPGEVVGCGVDCFDRGRMAWAVTGIVDEYELRIGPFACELPGGIRWAADVEAAVDEHSRDPGEPMRITNELVVVEERCVAPVVRHDPGEAHAEAGIVVTGVVSMPGGRTDVGVFPLTPSLRRHLAGLRVRGMQAPVAGRGEG